MIFNRWFTFTLGLYVKGLSSIFNRIALFYGLMSMWCHDKIWCTKALYMEGSFSFFSYLSTLFFILLCLWWGPYKMLIVLLLDYILSPKLNHIKTCQNQTKWSEICHFCKIMNFANFSIWLYFKNKRHSLND